MSLVKTNMGWLLARDPRPLFRLSLPVSLLISRTAPTQNAFDLADTHPVIWGTNQ